jgi:hypothetical protein
MIDRYHCKVRARFLTREKVNHKDRINPKNRKNQKNTKENIFNRLIRKMATVPPPPPPPPRKTSKEEVPAIPSKKRKGVLLRRPAANREKKGYQRLTGPNAEENFVPVPLPVSMDPAWLHPMMAQTDWSVLTQDEYPHFLRDTAALSEPDVATTAALQHGSALSRRRFAELSETPAATMEHAVHAQRRARLTESKVNTALPSLFIPGAPAGVEAFPAWRAHGIPVPQGVEVSPARWIPGYISHVLSARMQENKQFPLRPSAPLLRTAPGYVTSQQRRRFVQTPWRESKYTGPGSRTEAVVLGLWDSRMAGAQRYAADLLAPLEEAPISRARWSAVDPMTYLNNLEEQRARIIGVTHEPGQLRTGPNRRIGANPFPQRLASYLNLEGDEIRDMHNVVLASREQRGLSMRPLPAYQMQIGIPEVGTVPTQLFLRYVYQVAGHDTAVRGRWLLHILHPSVPEEDMFLLDAGGEDFVDVIEATNGDNANIFQWQQWIEPAIEQQMYADRLLALEMFADAATAEVGSEPFLTRDGKIMIPGLHRPRQFGVRTHAIGTDEAGITTPLFLTLQEIKDFMRHPTQHWGYTLTGPPEMTPLLERFRNATLHAPGHLEQALGWVTQQSRTDMPATIAHLGPAFHLPGHFRRAERQAFLDDVLHSLTSAGVAPLIPSASEVRMLDVPEEIQQEDRMEPPDLAVITPARVDASATAVSHEELPNRLLQQLVRPGTGHPVSSSSSSSSQTRLPEQDEEEFQYDPLAQSEQERAALAGQFESTTRKETEAALERARHAARSAGHWDPSNRIYTHPRPPAPPPPPAAGGAPKDEL